MLWLMFANCCLPTADPFDVIKTRLQAAAAAQSPYKGGWGGRGPGLKVGANAVRGNLQQGVAWPVACLQAGWTARGRAAHQRALASCSKACRPPL